MICTYDIIKIKTLLANKSIYIILLLLLIFPNFLIDASNDRRLLPSFYSPARSPTLPLLLYSLPFSSFNNN